jgi:hypothetical protein
MVAGALFDRFGSYASTVWVAEGINVLGMPHHSTQQRVR